MLGMNGTGGGTLTVSGFYQRCVFDSGKKLSLTGTLSTDATTCDDTIDSSVCAIIASNISIDGSVAVVGKRPLLLVATGEITVDGSLSLSTDSNGVGAGADWSSCDTTDLGGTNGDGGAGGTLDPGFPGGDGGASSGTPVPSPVAVKDPFSSLHGGCQGGTGSPGLPPPTHAGGAVYLMATAITITGGIQADGAAGAGGAANGGGYGGGSGGMIALDAPTIAITGTVYARGGGGGGGGGGNGGGQAGAGDLGGLAADPSAGAGGNGSSLGTVYAGGPGTGNPIGMQPGGGGGGGGGAGAILLFTSHSVNGGFDPAPIQ